MNNLKKNTIIRTKSHARLRLVSNSPTDENYNWVFIPGGPGLGSESLTELTSSLDLPGSMWLFDFLAMAQIFRKIQIINFVTGKKLLLNQLMN